MGREQRLYSEEAEAQLLGAALLTAVAADFISHYMAPDDFYVPKHQLVAAAIDRVVGGGGNCDWSAVMLDLEQHGDLGRVGGKSGLLQLQAACGSSLAYQHYGAVVLDYSARRRVYAEAVALGAACKDPDVSVVELLDRAGSIPTLVPVMTAAQPAEDVWGLADANTKPDWLATGLLERRERLILTGPEGYGKSTFMRQLAVLLAAGFHPANLALQEPCRVLIVDVENNEGQVWRGMKPLLYQAEESRRPVNEGQLRVAVKLEGVDLTARGDAAWLLGQVHACRPDVLVIGPLYKLLGTADPTDEDTARQVAGVLDVVRNRYGCALLIEAHSPYGGAGKRPERPYGASLWSRWPEQGLCISPDTDRPGVSNLRAWRPPREERSWPEKWTKSGLIGGGRWAWTSTLR